MDARRINVDNAQLQLSILAAAAKIYDKEASRAVLHFFNREAEYTPRDVRELNRFIDFSHQQADNYRQRFKQLKTFLTALGINPDAQN